jgi:hypothetical protein
MPYTDRRRHVVSAARANAAILVLLSHMATHGTALSAASKMQESWKKL